MKDAITKIEVFIKTNRRIILPLIPLSLIFFGVLFFNFGSPTSTQQTQPTPSPTQTLPQEAQITIPTGDSTPEQWYEDDETSPEEEITEFQNKETRSNGNTLYTFATTGSARPRITILSPTNQYVFRRIPATTEFPLPTINYIIGAYGQPQTTQILKTIYGDQTTLYFYTDGSAYFGNGQTGELFEYQLFPPMDIGEYLTNYKDYL